MPFFNGISHLWHKDLSTFNVIEGAIPLEIRLKKVNAGYAGFLRSLGG
jgi:hypothetical protein